MSYQVLAQKYRPQVFDDVIGQEAATRTLKNAISQGRIANAYVFCGPRGIGKTSVARVLAKTLNCEKPLKERPCNECASCREISQGSSIDVLEIDGASNRGIDEIRTLRENVKFLPSKGDYKIYIIDEVHMLTQEAFNALLKTLEEPPRHVKFIFATTEPHKVLATIMSRCQRFDFKRIPPKVIYDCLMDIAKKEKVDIEEKAALLISRSADGSLRDSQVILDQMMSFSDKKITSEDVIELLGMVQKDKVFELTDAVIDCQSKKVAEALDELINSGKDPVFITNNLIGHFRDLMILKSAGKPTSDMAFSEDELERFKKQLEKVSLEEILYILQNLSNSLNLMKSTMFVRAPLEITLIRLTRRQAVMALPEIMERLEKMEGALPDNSGETYANPIPQAAPGRKNPIQKEPIKESNDDIENDDIESKSMDFEALQYQWKAVLGHIKNEKMSIFTFLGPAKVTEFTPNKIVIGFDKDHAFYKEALEAGDNVKVVEEAVKAVTGHQVRVDFTILEFLGGSSPEREADDVRKEEEKAQVKPIIEKAIDIFGGHVVRDISEDTR